jgi:hypothetical protein
MLFQLSSVSVGICHRRMSQGVGLLEVARAVGVYANRDRSNALELIILVVPVWMLGVASVQRFISKM